MPSKQCRDCATQFPTRFMRCPACETELKYHPRGNPDPQAEIDAMIIHARFEREYARYDAGLVSKCGPGRSGPDPEILGRREAQRESAVLLDLEQALHGEER